MGKDHWIHKIHLPGWVVGILALVFVLRIPSFLEPNYYGDEMIYLTLGQGVRQGVTLYKDLHDNKPPMLYLTAAAAGNIFWFKVILAFWSLLTVTVFYKLARVLLKSKKAIKASTLIFALLTTLPLLEGNIANAENFMIGPIIVAFLLLLGDKLSPKKIFFAGFLFGIATLFKVPALFDAPVIVFYWIITRGLSDWKKIFRDTLILLAGFALPLFATFVWYFFRGALPEYIKAGFMQNVGYLSSFRPTDIQKPFLVRNAPLLIRAFIVFAGVVVLWISRKRLSKNFILFSLWTLFALFAVTLSERPYPHYLLQVAAPVSFFLAMFFTEKSFEQSLVVIPLALTLFAPVYFKFWIYPTSTYYERFVDFATGNIDKQVYFSKFSKATNRNYELADFLAKSSLTSDRVFMWDPDSATVYALARRLPPIKYVVPYHVRDFSSTGEVAKQIEATAPRFIILTSGNPYPELNNFVKERYILIQQIKDASIYVKKTTT
jgi:hypothetical protein